MPSPRCPWGNETVQYVRKVLSTGAPTLKTNDMHFTEGQGKALALALEVNQTPRELNLHGNWIDTAGTQALAEALRVNTTLVKLDLVGNNICDSNRPRSPALDDIARRLEANAQRTPPTQSKSAPSPG